MFEGVILLRATCSVHPGDSKLFAFSNAIYLPHGLPFIRACSACSGPAACAGSGQSFPAFGQTLPCIVRFLYSMECTRRIEKDQIPIVTINIKDYQRIDPSSPHATQTLE